eukprot:TRINITY_DN11973_c2_g3_i2.p2 TRINITY_DN11973_c2_g3~~TRINITY_DN11973_c2_g3_i2.p2  ORF type:complete len:302 (+),score=20.37 TRINITY_DN11973_c2_g3_i2:136-906(+)
MSVMLSKHSINCCTKTFRFTQFIQKLFYKKQYQKCQHLKQLPQCQAGPDQQSLHQQQEVEEVQLSEEEYQRQMEQAVIEQESQRYDEELYLGIFLKFFLAIAQGHHVLCGYQPMSDTEEYQTAQELRYQLMDFMEQQSDMWKPLIHEDFDGYVERMRDPDTMPTDLEISAATEVLGRAIRIYTRFNNGRELCSETYGERFEPKGELEMYGQEIHKFWDQNHILRLLRQDDDHYDILISVPEETYREAMTLQEEEKS